MSATGNLRIVFAGTPDFAVPPLEALIAGDFSPLAVYTQPDRPAGRGRKLRSSPVKEVAEAEGLPVLTPERPSGADFLDQGELAAMRQP